MEGGGGGGVGFFACAYGYILSCILLHTYPCVNTRTHKHTHTHTISGQAREDGRRSSTNEVGVVLSIGRCEILMIMVTFVMKESSCGLIL